MNWKIFLGILPTVLLLSLLAIMLLMPWDIGYLKNDETIAQHSAKKNPFYIISHCSRYDAELNNVREALRVMAATIGECHESTFYIPIVEVRQYMHSLLNDILREGYRQYGYWCEHGAAAMNLAKCFETYHDESVDQLCTLCAQEYKDFYGEDDDYTDHTTANKGSCSDGDDFVRQCQKYFFLNFFYAFSAILTVFVIFKVVQTLGKRSIKRGNKFADTQWTYIGNVIDADDDADDEDDGEDNIGYTPFYSSSEDEDYSNAGNTNAGGFNITHNITVLSDFKNGGANTLVDGNCGDNDSDDGVPSIEAVRSGDNASAAESLNSSNLDLPIKEFDHAVFSDTMDMTELFMIFSREELDELFGSDSDSDDPVSDYSDL